MDIHQEIRNYTLNKRNDNFGIQILNDWVHVPSLDVIWKLCTAYEYYPWIFSLIGSILVGLSGVLPLLIIPIEEGENLKSGAGARRLKILLSFAVGGLLGDVFLHLLPEAWENQVKTDVKEDSHPSLFCGVWVLIGMLVFVIVEKLFSNHEDRPEPIKRRAENMKPRSRPRPEPDPKPKPKPRPKPEPENNVREIRPVFSRSNDKVPNYIVNNNNNNTKYVHEEIAETRDHYHISGYLNLMANSIDNFTHGLAIGGSFCISFKIGVLSTFAILVHEIPHEVGDFAILLKSGFSRWDAARAQICTASAGIFGSMIAVGFGSKDSIESKTSWILPFTAGGFLHIALVTVLPELINEKSRLESFKQIASLILGIVIMALLILFLE